MSLDVYLTNTVHSGNITHNLGKMAKEAGLYEALWCPEESGYWIAKQLIPVLDKGLWELKMNPEKYEKFNAENGWGVYENLVDFVEEYLKACRLFPDADVGASR